MKRSLVLLSFILTSISWLSANEITWEKEIESAFKKAKAENKIIIVDVYTDWCSWCTRLDETTYIDKEVVAFPARW